VARGFSGAVTIAVVLAACAADDGGGSDPVTGSARPSSSTTVITTTSEVDPEMLRTATGAGDGPADERIGAPLHGRRSNRDLEVGMCVNESLAETDLGASHAVTQVVPCTMPHDAEVYARFDHPGGPDAAFPGELDIERYAARECAARFEPFIGLEYARSALDIATLLPDLGGWREGDREIVCSAFDSRLIPLRGPVGGIAR
jgi:hypothetical protein